MSVGACNCAHFQWVQHHHPTPCEVVLRTPAVLFPSKLTKDKPCLFLLLNGECPKVRLDRKFDDLIIAKTEDGATATNREDLPPKTKVAGHWI